MLRRSVLAIAIFLLFCGTTSNSIAANLAPRIISGQDAPQGTYPYMVSFQFASTGGHGCGGTLIAPNWVLTAAHCMYSGDQPEPVSGVYVYTGLYRQSDTSQASLIPISRYILHPQYDSTQFINDIALVELQYNALQDTATLNAGGSMPSSSFALGWGLTQVYGSNSDTLQYLDLPLVDNATCNSVLQNMGISVIDSQICAGYVQGGADTCQNDSGGPLFINTANGVQQVGIVSYGQSPDGTPCGGANSYGVYTRVSSYLDWIGQYVPGVASASSDGQQTSSTATLSANLSLEIPSILWDTQPQSALSASFSYIPGTWSFVLTGYAPISAQQSYTASLSSSLLLYVPQISMADGNSIWAYLQYDPYYTDAVVFTLVNYGFY